VTPVLTLEDDEVAVSAAESIAGEHTRVTALYISLLPDEIYPERLGSGSWIDVSPVSRAEREDQLRHVETRMKRLHAKTRVFSLELNLKERFKPVAAAARCADVAIMRRPGELTDPRRQIFETLLFHSGRPVIVVPERWQKGLRAERVVIGWNGSRESARAVADARPWLAAASSVHIVIVDQDSAKDAGEELRMHLGQCGVDAELRRIEAQGRSHGKALFEEADLSGADMIVMGGYGRSSAMEMVFGGATHHFVTHADRPVLFSH
jgi:nucleotide-binding universal stress UspA family protein